MFIFSFVQQVKMNEGLDKICQEEGYEQRTDSKFKFYENSKRYYGFECDEEIMVGLVTKEIKKECTKFDKWDDCIRDKNVPHFEYEKQPIVNRSNSNDALGGNEEWNGFIIGKFISMEH